MADGDGLLPTSGRLVRGGSAGEAEMPVGRPCLDGQRASTAQSPFAQGLRRLRRNRIALVGAAIVAVLLLTATFADVLAPQSPIGLRSDPDLPAPELGASLGTDQLGRDMLSRIIHGTRISLAIGVTSVLLALFVGVPLGLIAGYHGGAHRHHDHAADGPDPGLPDLSAGHHPDGDLRPDGGAHRHHEGHGGHRHRAHPHLCAAGPRQRALDQGEGVHRGLPRARRGQLLDPDPPHPAQLHGADHRDDHARHRDVHHRRGHAVLPRAGDPATDAELGWDLKANVAFIQANAWLSLFPGLAIFVTVLGFNLFGDGLRDALDPRLK